MASAPTTTRRTAAGIAAIALWLIAMAGFAFGIGVLVEALFDIDNPLAGTGLPGLVFWICSGLALWGADVLGKYADEEPADRVS